jgi:sugar phosphate isomerase/epimerase
MQLSIWTSAYMELPAPAAVRKLRSLGWTTFEFSTEHLCALAKDPDPAARIAEFQAALAETGSRAPQAHSLLVANVAHSDPVRRRQDLETVETHLRLCARLGVRDVVVHPGGAEGYTSAAELKTHSRLNVEACKRLGGVAGELGLRIAIENVADAFTKGRRWMGSLACELLELIDAVGSPALGVVFDTSHANLQRLDLAAAIRELAPKLIGTHISDNDGSGDQHLAPGHGKIDWRAFVAALREIGYSGSFNLEIGGERHAIPEIQDLRMRQARELAAAVLELQSR